MMLHSLRPLRNSATLAALTVAALASTMSLTGCGAEEAPVVVQAPPPPPPPPPAPTVTPISELMAQHNIDPRVVLPEDRAPETDAQRVAVLKFFDAFVRGNADGVKSMLSGVDQILLESLVESGEFARNTEAITKVKVECATEDGNTCTLGIFETGTEFQPQLWVYTATDASAEFDSVAALPGILEKLSGENRIAAWFKLVKAELAKAEAPDEVIEIPQTDFTAAEAETTEAGGSSAPATAPAGPGKRPVGAPIDAPKAPGFGNR
jgi:hypothetical protein